MKKHRRGTEPREVPFRRDNIIVDDLEVKINTANRSISLIFKLISLKSLLYPTCQTRAINSLICRIVASGAGSASSHFMVRKASTQARFEDYNRRSPACRTDKPTAGAFDRIAPPCYFSFY